MHSERGWTRSNKPNGAPERRSRIGITAPNSKAGPRPPGRATSRRLNRGVQVVRLSWRFNLSSPLLHAQSLALRCGAIS